LLAGRVDLEDVGVSVLIGEPTRERWRLLLGARGEDHAEHEEGRHQGADSTGRAQLDAPATEEAPRLRATLGSVAADHVDQRAVDREDQEDGRPQADPIERGDVVRVG
jgi:hypothetical protein